MKYVAKIHCFFFNKRSLDAFLNQREERKLDEVLAQANKAHD